MQLTTKTARELERATELAIEGGDEFYNGKIEGIINFKNELKEIIKSGNAKGLQILIQEIESVEM